MGRSSSSDRTNTAPKSRCICSHSLWLTRIRLYNRGLLLSISQVSPRQYEGLFITFSSDEIGVFKIDMNVAGDPKPMASEDVRLEDMLQMQFENKSSIAICEGNVKCNLNVLLFQLYKK